MGVPLLLFWAGQWPIRHGVAAARCLLEIVHEIDVGDVYLHAG